MAQKKNRALSKRDAKPASAELKNGRKADGVGGEGRTCAGGGSRYPMLTWVVALALLGAWSSVAVVYFNIVDYDSVIARAKEFHMNFSEVLQGKLMAYDSDGDGDFDMEDAKVLLAIDLFDDPQEKNKSQGLKGPARPDPPLDTTAETANQQSTMEEGVGPQEHTSIEDATENTPSHDDSDEFSDSYDVESDIQGAVPLPAFVEEEFEPDDELDAIDSTGALVLEAVAPDSSVETDQLASSKLSQETEPGPMEPAAEPAAEPASELSAEPAAELAAEPQGEPGTLAESTQEVLEQQTEENPKDKVQKKKPKLFNKFDKTIKSEIDAAEKLRKKGKLEEAVKAFESLVQKFPQSPRARYGKAQAEDDLAENLRSNDLLQKAINTYRETADLPDVTPDLLRSALSRRAQRQQFLGRMRGALATMDWLVQTFPDDVGLRNELGVAYLLLGDNKGAKRVYEEVLAIAPNDGFAKVHYGFILKSDNKIAESVPYLKEGLESGDKGTDDGRFYFHLGDALQRLGDKTAYHWYELGHQRGHFASVYQRSLYNVKGLKAQPWWSAKETGYTDLIKTLERNWKSIRDEALSVLDQKTALFLPEDENLRETGDWGQYTLWQQGRKVADACHNVPKTCSMLERFSETTGCKRGQIKFSIMQPGTHVWPHTGPTNCRLRLHLGLVIPPGCRIRCTNQTREWEEGKVLIFDDSFEHEVWQDADSYRLIFIVDVWHPELTASQRQTLSPI